MDDISNIFTGIITVAILIFSAIIKNKKKVAVKKNNDLLENDKISDISNLDVIAFENKETVTIKNDEIKNENKSKPDSEVVNIESSSKKLFNLKQAIIYDTILNRKYF